MSWLLNSPFAQDIGAESMHIMAEILRNISQHLGCYIKSISALFFYIKPVRSEFQIRNVSRAIIR